MSTVTEAVELIWENAITELYHDRQETELNFQELSTVIDRVENNPRFKKIVKKSPASTAIFIETKIKEYRQRIKQ